MNSLPPANANTAGDANIKSILEWLALAHDRNAGDSAEELHGQIIRLREAAVPTAQRIKLLDLLYAQGERVIQSVLPSLHETALPVSRKQRQRVRSILELLSTLTQDYFNSLADLFDPLGTAPSIPPQAALRRAMHGVAWQIRINQLIASPGGIGLWQQMHSAFNTARRLGLADTPGPRARYSIRQIYTSTLLSAIAQPASFCPEEQAFAYAYIEQANKAMELLETPPLDSSAIFWIDLDKDFPAHALVRRAPSADARVLYFSCSEIARTTLAHIEELDTGAHASSLGLPAFAETRAGRGVLRRLQALWGHPVKRRFPRRRQSYRVHLCSGLDKFWRLLKHPENSVDLSEWMVTNESPDGYALMHVAGQTHHLRVGDIAALQPIGERGDATPPWHVCIVRWALSENPEHIELGLQLLASRAEAAEIVQPLELEAGHIAALMLPETPPLRRSQALITPTGAIKNEHRKIIVMLEHENLEIREVRPTQLDEQTSSIEIFSVSPDETA